MQSDCIYLIDELEDSLHYDLVLHILLRFIRNSTHSQLIFTTHNILLLDEDFIRRDMVKLVEKLDERALELKNQIDSDNTIPQTIKDGFIKSLKENIEIKHKTT